MSDSPVVDWGAIVHKDVRSKDGGDVGIVDAVDEDSIVIGTWRVQTAKIRSG